MLRMADDRAYQERRREELKGEHLLEAFPDLDDFADSQSSDPEVAWPAWRRYLAFQAACGTEHPDAGLPPPGLRK